MVPRCQPRLRGQPVASSVAMHYGRDVNVARARTASVTALTAVAALVTGCAAESPPAPAPLPPPVAPTALSRPDEPQLADLRRLTFGGENAEAYWSWDGTQLVFQAREGT